MFTNRFWLSLVSLTAAIALNLWTVPHAASATASSTVKFLDSDLWKNIPAHLHWTQRQLTDAQSLADSEHRYLVNLISASRSQGAVKMTARKNPYLDPDFAKAYPEYSSRYSSIGWIGIDSSGRPVDVSGSALMSGPKPGGANVADLFQLNQDGCSLQPFDLFKVATWFQKECKIIMPSLATILRVSLISALQNSYDFEGSFTEVLQTIAKGRLPYKVKSGRLYCSISISEYCATGFTLESSEHFGTSLRVLIGPGRWDFTMKVARVSAQDFASHLTRDPRPDGIHIPGLTPFGTMSW